MPMADFGCIAAGPLPQFPHLLAGKPACALPEQRLGERSASAAFLAGGPLCASVCRRAWAARRLGRCADRSPMYFRRGSQRGCWSD